MLPSDILIGALSAVPYDHRRNLVRETWGADCDRMGVQYYSLIGDNIKICDVLEQDTTLDQHIWVLPCPDAYQFLPQKTRHFCRAALQFPNWKWLLKTDDDSYISVPRLLQLNLVGDYIGAEYKRGVKYASGAGYFVSRKAVEILADRLRIPTGAEDLCVGLYLHAAGIAFTIDNEHIIPFATRTHRGSADNTVVITHRLLVKDTPFIDREPWMLCHQETGLDAITDH